ncbi:MAG: dockerin type I repeat-containing protein [Clostridia bacterium]|nr:dockerin type I repeat-containing protein [Clostridia bacterium]
MKRKILSLLTCVCVLLSTVCVFSVAAEESPITLKYYDDRMSMIGHTVQIIDPGTPTSYQVGYGVKENTLDTAVVQLTPFYELVATGIGTAVVEIDGVEYTVNIEPAPISLFLLMGQSNMEGDDGDAGQSIANPNGTVYSTYASWHTLKRDPLEDMVPSALAGEKSTVARSGKWGAVAEYPIDLLTVNGPGKWGMDSALAYEWVQRTGEKVWVINSAYTGSSIDTWQPSAGNFKNTVGLMEEVFAVLQGEIAAGHYTFSHMGYFWCQGCTDAALTAEKYTELYLKMHEGFMSKLLFDHDGDETTEAKKLEFGNIIMIRAALEFRNSVGYREGVYTDTTELPNTVSFKDLQMSGPRVSQYWLAANKDYPEINVVCNIGDSFVTMPDGSDGVAEYFNEHYENGIVDYPTQLEQADSWKKPTTPGEVHPGFHYYQIGYNELGREAARNTCYILGLDKAPETEATVRFVNWTGYEYFEDSVAVAEGDSRTLAVPIADPVYLMGEIDIAVSDDVDYTYFDATSTQGGTVTATLGNSIASFELTAPEVREYLWQFDGEDLAAVSDDGYYENALEKTGGTTENGVFSSTKYHLSETVTLLHNRPWEIEWQGTGGDYMLFISCEKPLTEGADYLHVSSTAKGVSFGERTRPEGVSGLKYVSYGANLNGTDIDMSAKHTYKLVNEIDKAGVNAVWLYVDGVKTSALTDYNIAGEWDGTSGDWVSGRDFSFNYIGGGAYTLKDCSIDYIHVKEGETKQPAPEYTIGDINNDGNINVQDIFRMKLIIKTLIEPTETERAAADITGDGLVNAADTFKLSYRVLNGNWA